MATETPSPEDFTWSFTLGDERYWRCCRCGAVVEDFDMGLHLRWHTDVLTYSQETLRRSIL